ncbi:ABC transporter, transmembrane ATP-binding protein [Rhodobacteraceae bacterium HTCC2150]|nr:ABC transporter, transmembrane ATP-binding protein [Rhodobacteraceae bacterium HTCC2150]
MFSFFENIVDPFVDYPENNTPPRRLFPFIWEYCKPFKTLFVWTGVMSVVSAAMELGLLYYLGQLVDQLSASTPENIWRDQGMTLLLLTVFVLFLRPVIEFFGRALLSNSILPNLGTMIRWRAHRHVLRQSVGWFEDDFAGRIANRIMQTPPAAGEAVFQVFDAIAFSIAYLVGAAILLSNGDLRLMVPLAIWSVLFVLLMRFVLKRVGAASEASSNARSVVTGRVVDSYTNIHSVKLFAHHDSEISYAREAIENSRSTFIREMRIYTVMDFSLNLLNGFLIVGVVGMAIYYWSVGSATLGLVAASAALVLRLHAMTGWIMWALSNFFQNLGVVSEGMQTIAQPITLLDRENAKPLALSEGEICFDDITHHYGRGSGGLDGLSLKVKPGEKVGVVGRSGAGKSTLVKLLLRFYDVENGGIRIDDQNIADVTQDSLRGAIGMVQQDSSLMHRSVMANIKYGKPDATDAEVHAATKAAAADIFIDDLIDPNGNKGYAAEVGERGVKLSGGQRQRVTLARVILKNAPILVLDEATSALDSEVEAAIQDTLYGVMQGKTVIAIAHRLSTIAQMDRIVVLEKGKIAEDGTHDELLAKGGLYAGFWARQSGGFIGYEEGDKT